MIKQESEVKIIMNLIKEEQEYIKKMLIELK